MKSTAITPLTLAFLIISLAGLSSCKKDKDQPAISIESISGSYKIAAWTYQYAQLPEEDLIQYMEDCEKDDILNFKDDKSFTNTDAGVQCTPPGGPCRELGSSQLQQNHIGRRRVCAEFFRWQIT